MGQQRFATSRGLLKDREEERKGPTGSPSRDGDSYPGAKHVFIGYSLGRAQLEAVGKGLWCPSGLWPEQWGWGR